MRNLLLLFVVVSNAALAQPSWKWAAHIGGTGQDRSVDVATDYNGNVITTGWFLGTIETDGFSATSAGHADAFLAKHDAQGTCLWLVGIGESSEDRASKVVVDGQGAVYVAGTFRNTLVLGADTLVSHGGQDIFLAKFSPNGTPIWARSGGCSDTDLVNYGNDVIGGLAVRGSQVVLGGSFGASYPNDTTYAFFDMLVVQGRGNRGFLVCYDTAGGPQWAKGFGAGYIGGSGSPIGLTFDLTGNIVVAGIFINQSIVLDNLTLYSISSGFVVGDGVIAKYSTNGNIVWAKSIGLIGPSFSQIYGGSVGLRAVTVDPSGAVYVTGWYNAGRAKFTNSISLDYVNLNDAFLAKYSSGGDFQWARSIAGLGDDYCFGLASDNFANIYMTGFGGAGTFFHTDTLAYNGGANAFVAKWDSSGSVKWLTSAGGTGSESGIAITTAASNTIHVTGIFNGGDIYCGNTFIQNAGMTDVFTAELSSAAGLPAVHRSEGDFFLVPNPASAMFSIKLPVGLTRAHIRIENAIGQPIQDLECERASTIDIRSFPNGIYIVRISAAGESFTRRLLVRH